MSGPNLPELDPVIHAQARLRVMVMLATLGADYEISFTRLQELLQMTAGNLGAHLGKLEEAGYITVAKTYRRRVPLTMVSLTERGRRAFEDYTAMLQSLLTLADASAPDPETPAVRRVPQSRP